MIRRDKAGMFAVAAALVAVGACGGGEGESAGTEAGAGAAASGPSWDVIQDTTHRVRSVTGFSGPEAVRYDPDQDVWFVSNFNGDGGERDANGFISRVSAADGTVETLQFAQGTETHPLHAPRGMFITGDTLWVADVDGVHGFDRRSGGQVAFIDLSGFEPGFLNDVAAGPDGVLYVTDTGTSTVYRVAGREASVALTDSLLANPNGITWDGARGNFVLVPWNPGGRVNLWRPDGATTPFGPTTTPGRLDGVEPIDRRLLVASQTDSSLVLMDAGTSTPVIRVGGRPADIGVDTRRRQVAVPFIALDRVDIWQLPAGG